MVSNYRLKVEHRLITYDPMELQRWQARDRALVPQYLLARKGPGIANGYHYGEFVVARHLENPNRTIINNLYDLFVEESKYKDNNRRIVEAIGDKYQLLKRIVLTIRESGLSVEKPDLCVLDPDGVFFAEVKRLKPNGRPYDRFRDPQRRFAAILAIMDMPFFLYTAVPTGYAGNAGPFEYTVSMPTTLPVLCQTRY